LRQRAVAKLDETKEEGIKTEEMAREGTSRSENISKGEWVDRERKGNDFRRR